MSWVGPLTCNKTHEGSIAFLVMRRYAILFRVANKILKVLKRLLSSLLGTLLFK